jgi:hypothetical protein
MSKFKSLAEFEKENPSLESLKMANVNGGLVDNSSTFICESRATQAEWSCADSQSRTRADGRDWGLWATTGTEQPDGSWSTEYSMPC